MNLKQLLYWLPMIVLAFANGTLRELVLLKHFNEFRAHQLSTLSLIVFCSVYVWLIFPQLNIQNAKQALLTGLVWMLLTIAFEFSLGRLTNKSWQYLFRDYDLFAGRIWLLFLLSLLILPYSFYMLRNSHRP